MKAWEVIKSPVFVISDLHAGDGGPRDSFRVPGRWIQLLNFLRFSRQENAILVVAGDLLELWQTNVSKTIVANLQLISLLSSYRATYLLGNHDADLNYFPGSHILDISLIEHAVRSVDLMVGEKKFTIIHGHEADPYCVSDQPGLGRITAILTGIAEDRHGGPMASKYKTIAQKVVGPMDRAVSRFRWLTGRPSREVGINRELLNIREQSGCDVLISGHTHKAGRIGTDYYNTGTWAEFTNSFVRINPDGSVGVYNWIDNKPVVCTTILPV